MGRAKVFNGKLNSQFICLKCLRSDGLPNGILRLHNMKGKNHIKDLYCVHCREVTKCLEVRSNDYLPDMLGYAHIKRRNYYS